MNGHDLIAPISVPNPKRAAIFDFLEADHDGSSPPGLGHAVHDSMALGGSTKARTPDSSGDFFRYSAGPSERHGHNGEGGGAWSGLDMLGGKKPSSHALEHSSIAAVPSLGSLASPWASQSALHGSQSNVDMAFDTSLHTSSRSGFGGMLTSSVGLDLQWTLSGSEPAVPLPGSRSTSAIGLLPPDVPLNTPQPISRPVSTKPAHDGTSLMSLLGSDIGFQRTITPPVSAAVAGHRSVSPRPPVGASLLHTHMESGSGLHGLSTGTEESRWPKPVRFAANGGHSHRSSLLDTPHHGSSHHLDGLLSNAPSTTPTLARPTSSSSMFSPELPGMGGLLGGLGEGGGLTRSGRDSIGSPFPAPQSGSLVHTELPFEALEQYRQSRESTPQLPSYPSHVPRHHHSPPPYHTGHGHHHGHHHASGQPHGSQFAGHSHSHGHGHGSHGHSHSHGHMPSSRSPGPGPHHHGHHHGHQPHHAGHNKSGFSSLDDRAVENVIVSNCYQILVDAAEHMLKAVELANTLRARVGTEVLAQVRERWGGLLSLLEKHKDRFLVERIPKNDRVRLLDPASSSSTATAASASGVGADGATGASESAAAAGPGGEAGATDAAASSTSTSEAAATGVEESGADKTRHLSGDSSHEDFASSYLEGGDAADGGAGGSGGHNHAASRCLHVGNVPNTYTDSQLTREFERFGVIEGLKLINQKNGQRRFAFITFQTIEQAIAARHALSKVHPWKSAISFAHKDLMRNGALPSQGAASGATSQWSGHAAGSASLGGAAPSSSSAASASTAATGHGRSGGGGAGAFGGHHAAHLTSASSHAAGGSFHASMSTQEHGRSGSGPLAPVASKLPPHGWAASSGGLMGPGRGATGVHGANGALLHRSSPPLMMRVGYDSIPIANTPSYQGGIEATHGQTREKIILQRLCDDTYVPTQPWPVDREADMVVGQSIIDQILQFGGNTTISKLRGFLKHRMGTVDNIKSVPLKAMLLAYPNCFHVEGNYVSLVSTSGGGAGAASAAAAAAAVAAVGGAAVSASGSATATEGDAAEDVVSSAVASVIVADEEES